VTVKLVEHPLVTSSPRDAEAPDASLPIDDRESAVDAEDSDENAAVESKLAARWSGRSLTAGPGRGALTHAVGPLFTNATALQARTPHTLL
jgi:hypothetical protein